MRKDGWNSTVIGVGYYLINAAPQPLKKSLLYR